MQFRPQTVMQSKGADTTQDDPGADGHAVKQAFVPGKPGIPRAGATHHALLRDPKLIGKLQPVIAKWEQDNPNRILKGPAVRSMLHSIGQDISESAAAKMAARIEGLKSKVMQRQVENLVGRAAKKTIND